MSDKIESREPLSGSSERLDEETAPPRPLDALTEKRIMDVMLGGYNSVSELRQRIRTLVSEAANNATKGYLLIHEGQMINRRGSP